MIYKNDKNCQLNILTLEDSSQDAELIYEYLRENFGSEIQMDIVLTEDEFVSALSLNKYNLILSDFNLPEFNGFEALEHARSICPTVPFICISGFIGEETAAELLKQGATDYVSKEKLGRLKHSIERALKEVGDQENLRETNLSLLKSEERYKALTETSIDGFYIADIQGRFLEVNDSFCIMSGYTKDELLAMSIKDMECNETPEQIDFHIKKVIEKEYDQFESRYRKADSTIYDVNDSITYMPKEKLFICFLHDITERKKQETKLEYLGYHDILTGLYNRTFFEEEIKRQDIDRRMPFSVIMGDINGLKLINDSFGHETGDMTIIEVANIIKSCCREEDIISRVGGDEFCILLPDTAAGTAHKTCQRIYDKCKQQKSNDIKGTLFLSISFGYNTCTVPDEPVEVIMKEAEASMYRHKLLETRSFRSSIVSSIMSTLRERYIETDEHSERMKKLSREIGIALGLSDSMLDDLELLAVLHDIGKISIRDTIINKNAKLSKTEMEEMKRHSETGYNITQATIEFQRISEYILAHHEKWDGSGYPRHIKGEEIPLLSRIIYIVDAYDAMTNNRHNRQGLSQEDAIDEIKECSGTQFDPKIGRVFIEKVLGKKW